MTRPTVPSRRISRRLGAAGLAAAAAVLGAQPLAAQSYLVHDYTLGDGIPSVDVRSVTQDRYGRMWFATRAGLAVFDGWTWETVQHSTTGRNASYTHVRTAPDGSVWAVPSNRSETLVAGFDGTTWTAIPPPRADGAIVGSVTVNDLEILGGPGREPTVALATANHGVLLWRSGLWTHLDRIDGLPSDHVSDLVRWHGGLAAVTDDGLALVHEGWVDPTVADSIPDAGREILAVSVDTGLAAPDQGPLWLLGTDWLGRLDERGFEWVARDLPLVMGQQRRARLLVAPPRSVFAATNVSFVRWDRVTGESETIDRRTGVVSRGATDLFSDREGNLWVTTTRGVSKVAAWQFASYGELHGLLEDEVSAVCERRPGSIVLGHNSGLTLMEDGAFRPIPFADPEGGTSVSRRVLDLYADADGSVWIAAEQMGLGHLSPDNQLRWSGTEAGFVLPVASVTRDRDGNLWVSSDRFLHRLTDEGFREQDWPHSGEVLARRLQPRAEGGLYLATTTLGLVVMDSQGRFTEPERPPQLATLSAYAALDTHDGRTLVGTSSGLLELREGRLERPPEADLEVTDPVYLLVEDDVGALWIGTDRGTVRWNGTVATAYTPALGLAGWETNRAAGLLDSRHQLWIGTDGGVSVYRRRLEREAVVPPLVRLDGITANDRPVSRTEAVELGHAANTLAFAFGAVSYLDERAVQYRYRLAGFESVRSVVPAHVRAARYTNLPPGRYTFELEACNAIGVWSETVSSPAITVRRPVWARWWFFVGTAAAAVGLLFLASAVTVRWRYATRLRHEVSERTDQLRESEARYRQLFDSAANPKLLVAPTGTIVDVNAPACEITGCDRDQLLGSSALSSPVEWVREAAERSEMTSEGSFLVTSGDGRGGVRDVEVWTTPVNLGGRRMLVVSAQDVTERRRLQEEHMRASKLESVRVLAAGVAHDFNNILTAVLGNISLTQMRLDGPPEVRRLLDRAEQALLRAKHLTTQLLTFTREVEPVRRTVDVGQLVREAATLMLSGSASTCTLDIAPDLWPAEVDEGQITQVIGNLVLNADQAMPDGGTVTIQTENATVGPAESEALTPGPYVKITVSDHGVGIPQEHQERVFDPYFTTKETGSGLGLATTYAVVTRHRGAITLSSNPGAGASFHVWLPASPDAQVEIDMVPGERLRRTARVLVMDDEEPLRELYVDMLTALGYEADAVPDGRAAIGRYAEAHAAGTPYQVVIMDLTVPGGMGGEETMRELRRLDPDVRAVVASGYLTDSVLASPVEVGFRARLNKPFTITELTETLDQVLRETDLS